LAREHAWRAAVTMAGDVRWQAAAAGGCRPAGDAEPDVVEELLREHAFLDRSDDRDEE
jgi:hypothetical protein